jgi:ABC-type amino acid transport system permease subunit
MSGSSNPWDWSWVMRAVSELIGVIVAGFVAFFGGILFLLGLLALWLCGLASALCLMVAAFAGIMYGITRVSHNAQLAVVYLVYAAVPFVVIVVVSYYWTAFREGRRQRRALQTIGGLRLAQDVGVAPRGAR